MVSPEMLMRLSRGFGGRRLKVWGINLMRRAGLRYLVVRMDTTNLCNLRCRMCYISAEQPRRREQMDLELFDKIARQAFRRTRLLFLSCATEPLMNRDFGTFLEHTGRYRIPFTCFVTNGMLLNEDVVRRALAARISEIRFSVDGATKETYEFIRRGADWETLLEKLHLLRRVKREAGSGLPAGRLVFTCLERNIRELPQLVRLAAEYGIASVQVRHLLTFGVAGAGLDWQEQLRYRSVFNEVAQAAAAEAPRLGVKLILPQPISPATPARKSGRREANPHCLIPWSQVIISPSGLVRLCSHFPPLGDLRKQSLADIFNGPEINRIRKALLRRSPDSCSWACAQEAFDAPDEQPEATEESSHHAKSASPGPNGGTETPP